LGLVGVESHLVEFESHKAVEVHIDVEDTCKDEVEEGVDDHAAVEAVQHHKLRIEAE
jgi:hypothetical protein